jgi:predicted nucleic acid-binding protein
MLKNPNSDHYCRIVSLFPFTDDIKNLTIEIKQSKKIKLPDAIIAATALHLNLPLLRADKDFRHIPGLTLIPM